MIFRSITTSKAVPSPIAKARRLTVAALAVSVSQSRHEDMLIAGARLLQSQEVSHLGHGDEKPGPGHETDYDRCRDVSRQVAQTEDRHEDLDSTGHHRQKKCRFGIGVRPGWRPRRPGR